MNTKTNLYYTTFIQITNKNLLGVKFFHLSSTLCADNAKNTAQMVNNQINQVNVNNLQVATYAPNPSREELLNSITDGSLSDLGLLYPWLIDESAHSIDYNKSVNLFNGVKLISKYIENKFFINSLELSDVKLTELLNLFLENEKVSVIDLYKKNIILMKIS